MRKIGKYGRPYIMQLFTVCQAFEPMMIIPRWSIDYGGHSLAEAYKIAQEIGSEVIMPINYPNGYDYPPKNAWACFKIRDPLVRSKLLEMVKGDDGPILCSLY